MKKSLYIVLLLIIDVSGYTQNQTGIEALRYFDTVKNRYITINVEFNSWFERYRTISSAGTQNAKLLSYQAWKPNSPYGQWSEWDLEQTMPIPYETKGFLSQLFSELYKDWQSEPLQGTEITIRDLTFIRILAIPNGQSSPFWFDSDGDLHSFHKLYRVLK
jgi:hypothetical protein